MAKFRIIKWMNMGGGMVMFEVRDLRDLEVGAAETFKVFTSSMNEGGLGEAIQKRYHRLYMEFLVLAQ